MGEGFEVYHIPQQSRREKLRVTTNLFSNQNQPPLTNATTDYYVIDDCNFVYTHQHQHQHQQQQAVGLSLSNKTHTSSLDLYGSILKGSKFLKPAQQLLDQIFQFHIHPPSPSLMELEAQNLISTTTVDYHATTLDTSKRSTLISLLDQVYKRYKHYYQQIQAVIASFETVSGLSSAAPFANLDLKAMSNNFRCLNNAITDQLQLSVKPQISYRKEELVWSNDGLYGQRSINNMGFVDHQPVWRPQRGLPKRAVTVLRAWLFDHFLHPYPTDTDKQLLAKQTGLSRNQVSNWFINARVRLWKPMVEEVHTLEARQVHKISSHIHEQEEEASPIIYRDPSHRSNQDPPSKRPRNENKYIMERNKEHVNFYDNLLSIHGANNGANGNRGVSLTLGLHQNNNAITLSEPFPLNSERFVIDGLDAQNRREIMRGEFLHDFGG